MGKTWLEEKSTGGGTSSSGSGHTELEQLTLLSDASTESSTPLELYPPSTASSSSTSGLTARQEWLCLHVLLPLEVNYKKVFAMKDILYWENFFAKGKWTRKEIVEAMGTLENTCKFLPTAFEWNQSRPKGGRGLPDYLVETPAQLFKRLEESKDPWGKFVAKTTRWGLTHKDAHGCNRMAEAYDILIQEALRVNRPRGEVDGFTQARDIQAAVRKAVADTVQLSRQKKSQGEDGGPWSETGDERVQTVSGGPALQ